MSQAIDILKQFWGYDTFRPNQERIINSVLAGFDSLALLPTGGGKSVCFQVPALMLDGITLVVSPLIALMQDQVERLRELDIKAEMLISGMKHQDLDRLLDNCVYGDVKLLYVSPERLRTELFLERFKKMKVALIAVDEAHCISQWGYDFRPSYLQIAEIRKHHPTVPVIALTATATPPVVKDIQQRLGFAKDNVFQSSFLRENLGYHVVRTEAKHDRVDTILSKMRGSTIVYAGTRKSVVEWARFLQSKGHRAGYYHAGLTPEMKDQMRLRWMQGDLRIMVATNAFGMGIDKADVRLVLHVSVPADLESYFQEAGRAGRDGQSSHAVLIWNEQDLLRLEDQVREKYPQLSDVKRVYSALGSLFNVAIGAGEGTVHALDLRQFSKRFNLSSSLTYHSLKLLETAGYIAFNENGIGASRVWITADKSSLYKYQVANPNADALIKTMLRSYGGLFERAKEISENHLATLLQKQPGDIRASLQQMHDIELLEYQPRIIGTVFTYSTERLNNENLSFPSNVYQNRKKIDFLRARAIKNYATRIECRNRQLLYYFGEEEAEFCGKCDVCRKSTEVALSVSVMNELVEAIRVAVSKAPISAATLLDKLSGYDPSRIKKLLRLLLDAGELLRDDYDLLTIRKNET